MILSIAWLLDETDYLRVQLPVGNVKVKAMPETESIPEPTPIIINPKTNTLVYANCKQHRYSGYVIPARTIKVYGYTMEFYAGCNRCRAKLLKEVAKVQRTKHVAYKDTRQSYKQEGSPTIEILIDGKLEANINGNYKAGMIKQLIKSA